MKKKMTTAVITGMCIAMLTGCGCKHEWQDATCTNQKTCTLCDETEGEALGHTWVEATCTVAKTCSVCSEIEGEALGHVWKEATCTEAKKCSVCGETEGEALGHTVSEETVTKEATCSELGEVSGVCSTCNETVNRDIPMIEHTAGDWVITEDPTEYTDGTRVKNCTVCGAEVEKETFSMTPEELKQLYKDQCEYISYDNLARTPADYEGKKITFSGYVAQVCSEASSALYYSSYRVSTSGRYDNIVYAVIDNYGTGVRILEDDYITMYGEFDGLYTYETVMGASITIPKIMVKYYD